MSEIVTYSLRNQKFNSDDFYKDVKIFTDEVLKEIEGLSKPLLDSFLIFYKNTISKEECIFEFLMLGVLWQVYSGDAFELDELPSKLLSRLGEMRLQNSQIKPGIDFLRGILSTLFLSPDLSDNSPITILTANHLDKLISWMSATGDFNYEVKRLRIWMKYFNTLSENLISEYLASAITLAMWFEECSKEVLGCYTSNVDCYLNTVRPRHYWKEDVIFCGRRRVEYHLNMVGAEIMNRAFRNDFLKKRYKIVIVPGCLRLLSENDCKAAPAATGYQCSCCTKNCRVCELTILGRKYGFTTLIVPHESSISASGNSIDILNSDTGVVGIACTLNLISGGWMLKDLGIPAQCVILDYCGCRNHWHEEGIATDINMNQLKLILDITDTE
jgi:hypothetical protein